MYDGSSVDRASSVRSELWDHGALVRHDPESTVRRAIELSPRNVTGPTFAARRSRPRT